MRLLKNICASKRGAAVVEFAIVMPLILTLIFGIWNIGIILFAQNGVTHAVEAGARYATIYPRPNESQIKEFINERYYGPEKGVISGPTLTYGVINNSPILTIRMSYTHETSVPFIKISPISLSHERTTYLAPQKN